MKLKILKCSTLLESYSSLDISSRCHHRVTKFTLKFIFGRRLRCVSVRWCEQNEEGRRFPFSLYFSLSL